jgi:hypothetical protein
LYSDEFQYWVRQAAKKKAKRQVKIPARGEERTS